VQFGTLANNNLISYDSTLGYWKNITTGTGVVTALGVNTGTAGAFVVNGGALGTPSSGTVTNLTGTASININGTVGATTPSTGAFTTLSSTGNTTLGDASTDTVTVNGYMGVGGAGATTTGLKVVSAALTGVAQDGIQSAPVATSAATSQIRAFTAIPSTAAAAFTCTTAYGFRAFDASTGAGSTITNLYGVYVNDLTQATNNYGIGSVVSSGTNKWNIYASGTADNYFAGNVGVGTTTPGAALDVVAGLIRRYTATASAAAAEGLRLEMSGNAGANRGYYLSFYGPNASGTSRELARIAGLNAAAGADTGGYLAFQTVSGATGTNAEQLRITSTGNVIVTGAGGLGYGTGSGGTVTQGTSRTTGVTLNKTNGAITMFSAAGSMVAATFTVTNSTVAATDTIILNQKSGTNLYIFLVTAVAAGSFNVTFYTTGGVATDAPVINFSVIKAVTA
jgi:hypothetical protein